MYKETKATTLSAASEIDGLVVVNMFAQKTEEGNVNFNTNIQNQTLYKANKDECDADIATFKNHVEEM